MAYPDIDYGSTHSIEFRKIRSGNYSRNFSESAHNFSNGEERTIFTQNITNGGYLVRIFLYPTSLFSTHTYDTSTFLHFCLGLEFNVYIDDQLFQTVHLSCARSGVPSSTTTTTASRYSSSGYYFYAEEIVMGTKVNTTDTPNTLNVIALGSHSSNSAKNNYLSLQNCTIIPCGIANGENGQYVGSAQTNHTSSLQIDYYGTICPMVKINNNIRFTAKYLFFNNLPDATGTATFNNVNFNSYINWVPIE